MDVALEFKDTKFLRDKNGDCVKITITVINVDLYTEAKRLDVGKKHCLLINRIIFEDLTSRRSKC